MLEPSQSKPKPSMLNSVKKNKQKRIVLLGAGGHSKVVIDALKSLRIEIFGIFDSAQTVKNVSGIPMIGDDTQLQKILKTCPLAVVCVGSIGNPYKRIQVTERLKKIGFKLPSIVHPSAIVSKTAKIGDGVFIAPGAVIGPNVLVGQHVIVNTHATIDHDCQLGNFVHIAPGVTLSGGVEVGENSHVGTGATVIEYKKIGANTLIGAGSVVIDDIPAECKAYGHPCRVVEHMSNVFKTS